jgi:hypothetical protein
MKWPVNLILKENFVNTNEIFAISQHNFYIQEE